MKLKTLLFTTLLALAGSAFGATPAPSTSTGAGAHMGLCKKDPAKCQAAAAKFDQWCSANAEKCTDLKAWAEKRREFCEANKPKCEEHRHRMMEHMKEWCAKNPDEEHCKKHAMKADEPGQGDEPSDDQQEPPPPAA